MALYIFLLKEPKNGKIKCILIPLKRTPHD